MEAAISFVTSIPHKSSGNENPVAIGLWVRFGVDAIRSSRAKAYNLLFTFFPFEFRPIDVFSFFVVNPWKAGISISDFTRKQMSRFSNHEIVLYVGKFILQRFLCSISTTETLGSTETVGRVKKKKKNEPKRKEEKRSEQNGGMYVPIGR